MAGRGARSRGLAASEEPEGAVIHHSKALRSEIRQLGVKLTEMNNDVRSLRSTAAGHNPRFDSLDLVHQGTVTANAFAADSSRTSAAIRDQLTDLTRRVEKLEKAR